MHNPWILVFQGGLARSGIVDLRVGDLAPLVVRHFTAVFSYVLRLIVPLYPLTAMLTLFWPLMTVTARVRSTGPFSLKHCLTLPYIRSGALLSETGVTASIHSSAAASPLELLFVLP